MAEALPKVQDSSLGLGGILQLFQGMSGLFGSGKTSISSTSSTNASPESIAQLDAIMQSVLGQNDSSDLNALIDNIMAKAKESLAPAIGQSLAAGNRVYSDTTLSQVASNTAARATGEAAQAKLNFVARNNETAAQLAAAKVNATKTTTQTQTQQTAATPAGKGLGVAGAALGAYSLYKSLFDKKKKQATQQTAETLLNPQSGDFGDLFSSSISSPGQTATLGENAVDVSNALPFGSEGTSLVPNTDIINLADVAPDIVNAEVPQAATFTNTSAGFGSPGVADSASLGTGAAFDLGAVDLSGGLIAGGALDSTIAGLAGVGGAVGDSVALGSAVELGSLADLGIGLGGAAEGAGLLETVGPAVAAWVICTELRKRGELSETLYRIGAKHIANLPIETIRGYHAWAIPYTRWMRRSKLARSIILPWATGRTQYLAGRFNALGWITIRLGEPLCWLIGKFCKEQNWQSLYAKEGA